MIDRIEELKQAARHAIEGAGSEAALEEIRVEYLGRKGRVTELLSNLGAVPAPERPAIGQAGMNAFADRPDLRFAR